LAAIVAVTGQDILVKTTVRRVTRVDRAWVAVTAVNRVAYALAPGALVVFGTLVEVVARTGQGLEITPGCGIARVNRAYLVIVADDCLARALAHLALVPVRALVAVRAWSTVHCGTLTAQSVYALRELARAEVVDLVLAVLVFHALDHVGHVRAEIANVETEVTLVRTGIFRLTWITGIARVNRHVGEVRAGACVIAGSRIDDVQRRRDVRLYARIMTLILNGAGVDLTQVRKGLTLAPARSEEG